MEKLFDFFSIKWLCEQLVSALINIALGYVVQIICKFLCKYIKSQKKTCFT